MTNFLDERLRTLAQLRMVRETHRQKRDMLMDGLHESIEWQENETQMREAERVIFEVEGIIKSEAINYYLTAGEKNAHAGTKIKVFRKIEMDHHQAKEYCLNNLPDALIVQNKTLEKVLKALPQLPEWATEYEEPQAQITADLTKVFGALDEAETRPLEELETAGRIIDAGSPVEEQTIDAGAECPRCLRTKNSAAFSGQAICDDCRVSENDDIPF